MLTPKKITKKEIMADALFLRKQRESKAPTQLERLKKAAQETKRVIQKVKKGGIVKKGMGFIAAQKMIMKKQGLSKERAGAILASGARKASAAAKRKNPNLKKVKSAKK